MLILIIIIWKVEFEVIMKIIKGIGIFFLYPCIMLGLGIYIGVQADDFFYPGNTFIGKHTEYMMQSENIPESSVQLTKTLEEIITEAEEESSSKVISEEAIAYGVSRAVAAVEESLCVDTEYILQEMDLVAGTMEETTYRIPSKYVGMTREQFLKAMDAYILSPPLSELERGFVDLEVLSFSRERVVVQMNYKFVQPGNGFYLAAYDNKVVVYLEDKSTIYIETDIELETLPTNMQSSIVDMLWVESEEELYGFLESYSS